ncbi:DUF4258 domain-containing protein (plasmid) [Cyanobacterium aponinum AL20118]|uniref:DUF4258 domain-containing protein n=1 Tax=Cyanobacterium aponinum AL20115 TaxID=3090662 RepID=A0AAF0ZDP7_9CHRO|nr:DUF4258 domain-containing protein [Cyanobacterium aponinum]WPF90501.1 DUF4258 domain-containing protein [Cyanobacterium aponinum AL20115]
MNNKYLWTNHARKRLTERGEIKESWVIDTIENPERSEFIVDESGEKYHYYKRIAEFKNRVLEVVTSANSTPIRIITLYFNRNMRKKL